MITPPSRAKLVCPQCGREELLAGKTIRLTVQTIRYRQCRHCGQKVLTRQPPGPPETIIRNLGQAN